jgi:hypothetical protein
MVICININGAENSEKRDKVLNNNVDFKGYVIDFRTSNNHAFGVIRLQLTESSVATFNDTLKTGIYPYRINGDTAEIYTTISDGLDYYDTISVNSKSHEIEFKATKNHKKFVSELYVIEDSYNIEFVKKETQFE